MKHVFRVACAGVWLGLLIAPAQDQYGMAGVPCAQYTKAARGSDILYHQASQWVLGYVSGVNAARGAARGATPLTGLTNDQILKSAGDYCAANPGSNLANAVNEWYATLPRPADPQAAEAKPETRSSGSLILNLDNSPKIKPLMDRR